MLMFYFHVAGGLISSIVLRGDHPTGIGHPHPPNPMYPQRFTKHLLFCLLNLQTSQHPQSVSTWNTWNMSSIWLISKRYSRTYLNKPTYINNNSVKSAKSLCTFFPSFSSEYCLPDQCALNEVTKSGFWYSVLLGKLHSLQLFFVVTLFWAKACSGLTLTVVTGYDLKSPKSCLWRSLMICYDLQVTKQTLWNENYYCVVFFLLGINLG